MSQNDRLRQKVTKLLVISPEEIDNQSIIDKLIFNQI